jgi:plastocyanin
MWKAGLWVACLPLATALAASCGPPSMTPFLSGTGGSAGASVSGVDSGPIVGSTMTITIPPGAVGLGPGAYIPDPATISVGTTVIWVNNDSVDHTASSSTGLWESGVIPPGGSFSTTFSVVGTFSYFCRIHGASAMSGVVIVE